MSFNYTPQEHERVWKAFKIAMTVIGVILFCLAAWGAIWYLNRWF